MSVVLNKRSEGKLKVLTKANELATYTVKICSNEKHFPKRYRWCITNKIVDTVIDINNFTYMANAIYVKGEAEFALRKQFQTRALAATYSLLGMIDIAYRTFGIESSRIEYWTRLIVDVQTLIRNWRKGDADRFNNNNMG